MKKIFLPCIILLTCITIAGCAKKINGQKAYKVNVSASVSPVTGTHSELIKIHGTTSAPDGYEVVAVKNDGKDDPVCNNRNMKNYVQVKKGKFTGYIDPLQYNSNVKKGTNLKYHFAAVKNVKRLGNKDKKAIKEKFESNSIKLSFNPVTEFVQSNVQKVLGSGAIVSKKSKTVFAITPKKDSNFENDVSESMYGDKSKWSKITNKINNLSSRLKTPAGRIALVLINPENHKKLLLVSIGGKAKVDSISSGTVNSNTSNASNMKSSAASTNASNDDSDSDDFDLGVILGYLLAYDDEYGNDSEDTNDDYDYSNNDSDDYSNDDNYNDNNDYDDYSNDDNYNDNNDYDDYSNDDNYNDNNDYDDYGNSDNSQDESSSSPLPPSPSVDGEDSFVY
ncbi:hypothetical protein [Limosilactobacillus reuteri]|uniref:hypothetical protein n=1 Tax=Limosilactobacillus reuteri TaxID=1598 RepID=UPI002B053E09|nr:hypothetical protein [Limosilactobacillus reuteri]